jgi:predicted histone-like DNA-binding protein
MAIKLKRVRKRNPRVLSEAKWYLVQEHSGTLSLNEIASELADRSSLSQGDVLNVLRNLVEVLPVFLKLGQTIRLEGFGTFHIVVQSEGTDTPEELTTHNVKKARIVFLPSIALKEGVEHLSYEIIP